MAIYIYIYIYIYLVIGFNIFFELITALVGPVIGYFQPGTKPVGWLPVGTRYN
jgi:hypothetical protein